MVLFLFHLKFRYEMSKLYYNLQVVCAIRNKYIDNTSEVENTNSLSVPI